MPGRRVVPILAGSGLVIPRAVGQPSQGGRGPPGRSDRPQVRSERSTTPGVVARLHGGREGVARRAPPRLSNVTDQEEQAQRGHVDSWNILSWIRPNRMQLTARVAAISPATLSAFRDLTLKRGKARINRRAGTIPATLPGYAGPHEQHQPAGHREGLTSNTPDCASRCAPISPSGSGKVPTTSPTSSAVGGFPDGSSLT